MAKETIAEKLARKSFESDAIQRSWRTHVQAFGPILEPAFTNSYQARVHLTAALNLISSRDLKGGLEKLKGLQKYVETDADKAAWLFFMGIVFEMAGVKEAMLDFYQQSAAYGHKFYMPYLKVAKSAHSDAAFDAAEENYHQAIDCFDSAPEDPQSRAILASAYTNLAACLTMMHRYDEAQSALNTACQLLPQQPGRAATQAILCAAVGDGEQAAALLDAVAAETPMLLETTRETVDKILSGQHPHFSPVAIDSEKIAAFWAWFTGSAPQLLQMLDQERHSEAFPLVQEQLALVFPFVERPLDLAFQLQKDGGCTVTFADFYMEALSAGYKALLADCPAALSPRWEFTVER